MGCYPISEIILYTPEERFSRTCIYCNKKVIFKMKFSNKLIRFMNVVCNITPTVFNDFGPPEFLSTRESFNFTLYYKVLAAIL